MGYSVQGIKLSAERKLSSTHMDYRALEQELPPPPDDHEDGIAYGRGRFFGVRAGAHAPEALQFSLAHPERVGLRELRWIGESAYRTSPSETLEWIQKLPQGLRKDNALYGMVGGVADYEFEEAKRLVAEVHDPEMQKKCEQLLNQLAPDQ